MQKLVFTNGGGQSIDLTSGNFGITNWEGLSGVGLNIQTQQVPFQDGGVFLDALLDQRELSVTVAMNDENNLEKRYRLRREMISALNPKLGEGALIYTNDFLSKQIHCIPQMPVFQNKNSNDSGTPKVSCSFTACNPYWEDLEEIETTIKEFGEITNNGDLPAQVKIDIQEGSSNPTIINQTTGKMLQLSGNFNDEIIINTNVGQKSVETQSMDFKWFSGGEFLSVASNGTKLLYNGTQNFIEDRYTGERTNTIILSKAKWINNEFIGFYGNKVYSSEDGINWTEYNTGAIIRITDINYHNGNYFVVTQDFEIYKSSNKTTWTSVHQRIEGRPLQCIDYLNDKYIAGGIGGWISVSLDGTTWTDYSTNDTGITGWIYKIIYQDGKYYCTTAGGLFVSTDGLVYTPIEGTTGTWRDLIYANSFFIAVGNSGKILTSSDGTNWTQRESGTEYDLVCIIYSNNIFYICGSGGLQGRSWNGKAWSIEAVGISSPGPISKIINAEGVLYCSIYSRIYKSRNGKNWELVYSNSNSDDYIKDIVYGNKKIVAVTMAKVVVSENGINWQEYTITYAYRQKIVYAKKLDLYAIINGTKNVWTSQDAINWTQYQNVSTINLIDIAYSEEQETFVAIGSSGTVVLSENGVDWEQINTGLTKGFSSIVYGAGKFVAFYSYYAQGQNTYYVAISTNGREWEEYSISATGNRMCFENNLFLILSTKIFTSIDGINWKQTDTVFPDSLNSCAYFEGQYLCGGYNALIVQSFITDEENLISKLTSNSDMTFNLAQGINNILMIDDNNRSCLIKFRQKYIGV